MFETKLIKCFSCQVHSSYLGLNFLIFFLFLCNLCNFLFLCSACYYNQRTIPYFSWYFRSLARSFPVLLFSFFILGCLYSNQNVFERGALGFSVLAIFHVGFSVSLPVAVSGFSVLQHLVFRFFGKNKAGQIPLLVSVQSDVGLSYMFLFYRQFRSNCKVVFWIFLSVV